MRVLVIGGGGREHALAWKLAQSPGVTQVLAAPGNPGIAEVARCCPAPGSVEAFVDLAEAERVDFTVVGPEAPLVAGIVDVFRQKGRKIVGPTQAAARLEGSKVFAKQFFERAGIPTAKSVQIESIVDAESHIKLFSFPLVLKADGLAAGKGVIIANNRAEALDAIAKLGAPLVIEEFLVGHEVSFIGLSNGREISPFVPAKDHKRLLDGDAGPNTGGMGAYADSSILSAAEVSTVLDRIMLPTLAQMEKEGSPFTGFLYAGLMMTVDGPKVLEFNARLGDPETQALLYGLDIPIAEVLQASAAGAHPQTDLFRAKPAACVVMASQGYPDRPRIGDLITGIDAAQTVNTTVFHAGTRQSERGIETAGGRVLGVTASGTTVADAIKTAYAGVAHIQFDGMQWRTDIGEKHQAQDV